MKLHLLLALVVPLAPAFSAPAPQAQELLGRADRQVFRLNRPSDSYADPEVHPERPELVFQSNGLIWTGALDPDTGRFALARHGKDQCVDTVSSLFATRNGPEYGLDQDGWAIFYNKSEGGGVEQIWRATPVRGATGGFVTEALSGVDTDRVNQLPSQWSDGPTTWLLYGRADALQPPGFIAWADEETPNDDQDVVRIVPGFAGFRWMRGSSLFTTTESLGLDAGEILLVDAETGLERTITDDDDVKFDPYPWRAPEFGDAICVLAIVESSKIAVYLDTGKPLFDRILTIDLPGETNMGYAQSPEPFTANGASYISLTLKDDPGGIYTDVTESEIWVYGVGGEAAGLRMRADDNGPGRIRHEAETFAGTNEVFLYYNEIRNGSFDLYLSPLGLKP